MTRKTWLLGIIAAVAIALIIPVTVSAATDTVSVKFKKDTLEVKAALGGVDPTGTYFVNFSVVGTVGLVTITSNSASVNAANPKVTERDGDEKFTVKLSHSNLKLTYNNSVDSTLQYHVIVTIIGPDPPCCSAFFAEAVVDPSNPKANIPLVRLF